MKRLKRATRCNGNIRHKPIARSWGVRPFQEEVLDTAKARYEGQKDL